MFEPTIGSGKFQGGVNLFLNEVLDDCEIMQFTGLLDKNGKEIYEGDIVRFPKYKKSFETEVRYSKFYAGFAPFTELLNEVRDTCQVIGNIYEHPELLQ